MAQFHAQERVARSEHSLIDAKVGVHPGMGLDIGVFGMEKGFGPTDGKEFQFVRHPAARVVATPGISLSRLVVENRAQGVQNGGGSGVLGSDHVESHSLPETLFPDQLQDFPVIPFEKVQLVCSLFVEVVRILPEIHDLIKPLIIE
jgi:hypothetical protein